MSDNARALIERAKELQAKVAELLASTGGTGDGYMDALEDIAGMSPQLADALEQALRENEQHAAEVLPEDVGCVEYIRALTARLARFEALAERARDLSTKNADHGAAWHLVSDMSKATGEEARDV